MTKDLFPPEEENREVVKALGEKIQVHLDEIASYYTRTPKITIVIRCPWLPDGDFVMSNDEDPEATCNSLMNLHRRSHPGS